MSQKDAKPDKIRRSQKPDDTRHDNARPGGSKDTKIKQESDDNAENKQKLTDKFRKLLSRLTNEDIHRVDNFFDDLMHEYTDETEERKLKLIEKREQDKKNLEIASDLKVAYTKKLSSEFSTDFTKSLSDYKEKYELDKGETEYIDKICKESGDTEKVEKVVEGFWYILINKPFELVDKEITMTKDVNIGCKRLALLLWESEGDSKHLIQQEVPSKMKVFSWNCRGRIEEKLQDVEFRYTINNNDIIHLTECNLGEHCRKDFGEYGYESLVVPRKNSKRGGGCLIFYRRWLKRYLTHIRTRYDSIVWLKINGLIFSHCKDLYIGLVYIPHNKSTFYDDIGDEYALYTDLQKTVDKIKDSGRLLLIGDFNGRCGNCKDFKKTSVYIETVDEINPNLFGEKILNLCKSGKLRLLNGSAHFNKRFTFANHIGRSIVDYAITDTKTFKETEFEVLDSNEFSDHSPIRTTFSLVDDILADKRGCLKSDKYDDNEFRVNVVQCPKCNRHRISKETSCSEIYHRLKTALKNYNNDTQDRKNWQELKKASTEYNKTRKK